MTLYTKPRAELFAQDAPVSEIKPFSAWLRGLGIAFVETGGFPEMESFNGLLQALNEYIKYLEQNGFAEWSADLEYPIGAGVRVGAVWYRAKTQNLNKPPATSQNDWSVFLNASDLSFSDPLQVVGSTVSIKDATTVQKGVVRMATSTEVANKTNVTAAVTPSNAATIAQSTDLGVGQAWQNVIGSRSIDATYTNSTGKPIQVLVSVRGTGATTDSISVIVGGVSILQTGNIVENDIANVAFIVPNNTTYSVSKLTTHIPNIVTWSELR